MGWQRHQRIRQSGGSGETGIGERWKGYWQGLACSGKEGCWTSDREMGKGKVTQEISVVVLTRADQWLFLQGIHM